MATALTSHWYAGRAAKPGTDINTFLAEPKVRKLGTEEGESEGYQKQRWYVHMEVDVNTFLVEAKMRGLRQGEGAAGGCCERG